MTVLLGLLAFFLVLNLAALTGWAPSTRDNRDWEPAQGAPARRGPVSLPAAWMTVASTGGAATADSVAHARHAQPSPRVDSSEPSGSRSDSACDAHAIAA